MLTCVVTCVLGCVLDPCEQGSKISLQYLTVCLISLLTFEQVQTHCHSHQCWLLCYVGNLLLSLLFLLLFLLFVIVSASHFGDDL